jgi:beta-glucosidase
LLKGMKNVTLLDIGPKFLDEKGFLLKDVMPDTTHPSEKGYEIWAKAIEPELKEMLGE